MFELGEHSGVGGAVEMLADQALRFVGVERLLERRWPLGACLLASTTLSTTATGGSHKIDSEGVTISNPSPLGPFTAEGALFSQAEAHRQARVG